MEKIDNKQAYNEGWCVTTCIGSMYFPDGWISIEKLDGETGFINDFEATAYVFGQAAHGSRYHINAIKYMETTNFNRVRELDSTIARLESSIESLKSENRIQKSTISNLSSISNNQEDEEVFEALGYKA